MQKLLYLSPIHKASRQIGVFLEQRMGTEGVSNPEGHLIAYLASYSPCSVGTLKQVFGHKGSTMTSLLDRLEQRGLLERTFNPEDRRSFLILLSAEGERVAERIRRHLVALEGRISSLIETRDLSAFHRVLEAIGEATQNEEERA